MPEQKILDRLRKLFALAEGEIPENASPAQIESLSNEKTHALKKAHELLAKYNLDRSAIVVEEEIGVEVSLPVMGRTVVSNIFKRANAKKASKNEWWRELADVIAKSQFCRVSYNTSNSDEIYFYGLDIDRELAIYTFNQFAAIANTLCKVEMKKAKKLAGKSIFDMSLGKNVDHPEWQGNSVFEEAFYFGFASVLREIYENEAEWNPITEKLDKNAELYANIHIRLDPTESRIYPISAPSFKYGILMGEKIGEKVGSRVKKVAKQNEETKEGLVKQAQLIEIKHIGNIYLAFDTSGSMYGDKLIQAKKGGIDFAFQQQAKGFAIGLINFDWNANHLISPQREINDQFINKIVNLRTGGSTNMAEAISIAIPSLGGAEKAEGKRRILCIVTDGMPDNENLTLDRAHQAKLMGIEIAAIGTDGCKQEFIDKLVSRKDLALLVDDLTSGMKEMGRRLMLTA